MKLRFVVLFVLLGLLPSVAVAQSAPTRVVAETLGGATGGCLGGLVGMVTGLSGSMLAGPRKVNPVTPIIGGITGASVGAIGGVSLTGATLGSDGSVGGATAGFVAGAAFSAAALGVIAATAKPGRKPRNGAYVIMLVGAALPIVTSAVVYEMSGG